MGKGFNNYMCKKFFHPASRDNLKRVWMAEQQAEAYKKKQEELRVQYEKEQDLHNNKALLSKESKDKLSVNFMYEPPPGAKKEREKEDNEPEYKFEWQRKYNAPRESYCKGDSEIRDQPFGIQVRNVRCIKCHKWGHINTDKECPLYSQAMSVVMANNSQTPSAPDALTLVQQMREDGLALKKSALSAQQHLRVPEHEHLMVSDDEEQSEITFLKTLSKTEKKKLLKKLQQLEKKNKKVEKQKLKKHKVTHKYKNYNDKDSNSSYSSGINSNSKKRNRRSISSSSSSNSSSSSSSNSSSSSSSSTSTSSSSSVSSTSSSSSSSGTSTSFDTDNNSINNIDNKTCNGYTSNKSKKRRNLEKKKKKKKKKKKEKADSVSNGNVKHRRKKEKNKAKSRKGENEFKYERKNKRKKSHQRDAKKRRTRDSFTDKKRKISEFNEDKSKDHESKKKIRRF
ncbi:corepressor interacting with RBPJ 1 [Osmia bicornis bicornis]|uniref:corepressor interacting with RBPJ 1 n=1 Tax=Osmia bicornis bicornis TaxID=1437191 RepID=UPI001EAE918A|nr:corepressor interacting with RBPJ 1 [Osmia bicornis bicornis]